VGALGWMVGWDQPGRGLGPAWDPDSPPPSKTHPAHLPLAPYTGLGYLLALLRGSEAKAAALTSRPTHPPTSPFEPTPSTSAPPKQDWEYLLALLPGSEAEAAASVLQLSLLKLKHPSYTTGMLGKGWVGVCVCGGVP
jgi:hypothetical protein